MNIPISAIALDAKGTVLRSALVPPRRVMTVAHSVWMAETPAGLLPRQGERATLLPMLDAWPAR
jgi:hypothetical protein